MEELSSDDMLILANFNDEDGTLWRAITVDEGAFVLSGHDSGPGVERILGCKEYEFERRLTEAETTKLRALLQVESDADLLNAVAERFEAANDLEAFLEKHDIDGTFWSQLGE